ncbi:Cell wall-associated hydrolase, NlpC family [Caloramator proteoclasticus DSM 10124]|uniref:Cell wall-associated hydrolase, NlpC family n=2 Tax=Caloramator TaxID=44258 RepID=A0A1M4TH56_9CLOT|nr:Cell wall-associated hydrolase, NlpC family [Caloramator proteoclasticus DSM 10124]
MVYWMLNKKMLSLTLSLTLVLAVALNVDVQAAKTTKQNKKVVVQKKNNKKVSVQKKKKTIKRTASRGRIYSRGSGSVIAVGNVEQVEDIAKSLLGVRYVYGGTTTSGLDCSGFVQYVYKKMGVVLPRTASQQARVGLAVSKDNLRKGDLVFFETVSAGISHVGIYLGDGKFIHASSTKKGVTISSLDSGYYSERYRGAVRILK